MLSLFRRNRVFIANITAVISGVGFGRLLAIAVAPILARLFTPEDFGIATQIVAFAMVLNSVSSLRYEVAIVLPTDEEEAQAVGMLALRILLASSLVLLSAVALIRWQGFDVPLANALGSWLFLLPVAVLLLGLLNILRRWAARSNKFKAIGVGAVANATVTAGTRVGFGTLIGSTPAGLVSGYLAGLLAEMVVLVRRTQFRPGIILTGSVQTSLKDVAFRYRDFAFFSTPTALLKSFSDNLPILLLGAFFPPAIVGFYALARRLVQVPLGLVGRSVRTVFMQRAIETTNRGRPIVVGLAKITLGLTILSVPLFTMLFLFGSELFGLMLGARWEQAGRFAEVLAPFFFSSLVLAPTQSIYVVLERQRILLILQILRTLILAGAFGFAAHLHLEALDALITFSAAGVAANLAMGVVAFWLAWSTPPKTVVRPTDGSGAPV